MTWMRYRSLDQCISLSDWLFASHCLQNWSSRSHIRKTGFVRVAGVEYNYVRFNGSR